MYESTERNYYMILDRYILTSLGLSLKIQTLHQIICFLENICTCTKQIHVIFYSKYENVDLNKVTKNLYQNIIKDQHKYLLDLLKTVE